ncbi:hypothetical protein C8Q76DRAFT_304660 [Earliella scabrosa]|nr:hypothetical protein C8Q76DRAFT_304660 [Earliella scabrosa]
MGTKHATSARIKVGAAPPEVILRSVSLHVRCPRVSSSSQLSDNYSSSDIGDQTSSMHECGPHQIFSRVRYTQNPQHPLSSTMSLLAMADYCVYTASNSLITYSHDGPWGSRVIPTPSDPQHRVTCAEADASLTFTLEPLHKAQVWAYYRDGDFDVTCAFNGSDITERSVPAQNSTWKKWLLCEPQNSARADQTISVAVSSKSGALCLDMITVSPLTQLQLNAQLDDPPNQSVASESMSAGGSSSTSPISQATNAPGSTEKFSRGVSVGALVGGILGGLVLLSIIGGVLFLWWMRRKQHQYASTLNDDEDGLTQRTKKTGFLSYLRPLRLVPKPRRTESSWIESRTPSNLKGSLPRQSLDEKPRWAIHSMGAQTLRRESTASLDGLENVPPPDTIQEVEWHGSTAPVLVQSPLPVPASADPASTNRRSGDRPPSR